MLADQSNIFMKIILTVGHLGQALKIHAASLSVGLALLLASIAHSATEGRPMPELAGATSWINSPPLNASAPGQGRPHRLLDLSCINCLRAIPYVEGLGAKYQHAGSL